METHSIIEENKKDIGIAATEKHLDEIELSKIHTTFKEMVKISENLKNLFFNNSLKDRINDWTEEVSRCIHLRNERRNRYRYKFWLTISILILFLILVTGFFAFLWFLPVEKTGSHLVWSATAVNIITIVMLGVAFAIISHRSE